MHLCAWSTTRENCAKTQGKVFGVWGTWPGNAWHIKTWYSLPLVCLYKHRTMERSMKSPDVTSPWAKSLASYKYKTSQAWHRFLHYNHWMSVIHVIQKQKLSTSAETLRTRWSGRPGQPSVLSKCLIWIIKRTWFHMFLCKQNSYLIRTNSVFINARNVLFYQSSCMHLLCMYFRNSFLLSIYHIIYGSLTAY